MAEKNIDIINKLGLHARAATKFANIANRFGSAIKVTYEGKSIDGKSIMALMLLAAAKGSNITITTEGKDELEALDALLTLISNRFDEEE
ncbi:MAG: phosphocarrier protein HPr [Lentisphaeria bacterium]|jgi:phosphocarrier protein HPr